MGEGGCKYTFAKHLTGGTLRLKTLAPLLKRCANYLFNKTENPYSPYPRAASLIQSRTIDVISRVRLP
jgi:hypothetical protein